MNFTGFVSTELTLVVLRVILGCCTGTWWQKQLASVMDKEWPKCRTCQSWMSTTLMGSSSLGGRASSRTCEAPWNQCLMMWLSKSLADILQMKLSQLFRSSFAKDGKDCKLHGDVERVLKEFHRSRKPIGYASFGNSSVYQCLVSKILLTFNRLRKRCVGCFWLWLYAHLYFELYFYPMAKLQTYTYLSHTLNQITVGKINTWDLNNPYNGIGTVDSCRKSDNVVFIVFL